MTGPDDQMDPNDQTNPAMTPDDALAADYALGALDRTARRDVELRMARDPAYAAIVDGWQALLVPLADAVAPVVPPAQIWNRISATIAPVAAVAPARSFWSSLPLWRALTAGATAVAAVAVSLLVARPDPVPPPAPGALLTAAMAATDKSAAVLLNATFDPARGAVILTPAAADASAGKQPELWVIVGTHAPRSLGVIDMRAPQAHAIPADLRPLLGQGVTLAISLEPAGGSPTGLPTGPVVAAGKLAAI